MPAWSMRRRLTRSVMLLVAALWIGGAAITGFAVRHEIDEIFDGVLRESTNRIIPIALLQQRLERDEASSAAAEARATFPKTGPVRIVLRAADGTILFRSGRLPDTIWPLPKENGFHDKGDVRYFARFLPEEKAWIEVGQALHERREAERGLLIGLAAPLLLLLPIAAFAVWRTVERATDPIARVAHELALRSGDHLAPIGSEGLPAELRPVIDAINTVMARLGAALVAERTFAGNAAHELRNPIASARAQVQVLAAALTGAAERARADNIAAELGQLGRRIERLLQISRAEAGLGRSRERTDLSPLVALLVEDYRRRPDVGSRLHVTDDTDGACPVAMDQDALAIVLRNVIENAVGHGAPDAPIEMQVGPDRTVRIANACVPVPPERLQDLKGRFRRGAAPRVSGTGLGLAIVETIMREAGGTVELRSPAGGRSDGFEVVLAFPGSDEPLPAPDAAPAEAERVRAAR